ncbi:hypothetical protein CWO90_32575 [Bradyrhizobium sp. Leo121]|nr:hypothetical protein CWO90_32575 [Bradyrhizobium sp. Leo121]
MKLFSVCANCNLIKPFDGKRSFGDFDTCESCGEGMDLWTEAGVRNENGRRFYSGIEPLPVPAQ